MNPAPARSNPYLRVFALLGSLVGLLIYKLAQERAFMLRLNAQLALCQRQIELNTRGPSAVAQAA
ncbi:MAG: hypothetical protein QM767_21060 [Anaeromyxobacter sp.]